MVIAMRLLSITIFILTFGLTLGCLSGPTLEEVNSKFKNKEISISLLNDFENIINRLKAEEGGKKENIQLINSLLFKHGLINLMINKKREKFGFFDFQECLENSIEHQEKLNIGCLNKFHEIGKKYGEWRVMKDIFERIGGIEVEELMKEVNEYEGKVRYIEELINDKAWRKCYEECEDVLKVSKHDDDIIRYKIECLKELKDDMDIEENMRGLKEEYFKLVNYEIKEIQIKDFSKFVELELFTGDKGDIVIRNCLKIDNEFRECKDLNRIQFKIGRILKLIQEIEIYYSFIYSKSEENVDVNRFQDIEVGIKDKWRDVIGLLFNKDMKIKNKNELDKKAFKKYGIEVEVMDSNFEILIELYVRVLEGWGYMEKDIIETRFVRDLFKIVKQGYYEIGEYRRWKNGVMKHKYYRHNKGQDKDLVDVVRELDNYIKKKKVTLAQKLLGKLGKGMKMSEQVRQKEEEVKRMLQQQQYQQQQYQHQQYQHQHQHNQHQQQHANPPPSPSVDHYKVLGVPSDASTDAIRRAYRSLVKENHPDKAQRVGKSVAALEEKVAALNNAWEVLSDDQQRAAYDAQRRGADARGSHGSQRSPHGSHGFPHGFPHGFSHGFSHGFRFGGL